MNEQLTVLLALEHQRDLLREAARNCCTRLYRAHIPRVRLRRRRPATVVAARACCA